MRPMRVVYVAALIASVSLAFVFSYRYTLKQTELTQYQQLDRYSTQALRIVRSQLAEKENQLSESRTKISELSTRIAGLEEDSRQLQALKQEKMVLNNKIAQLVEDKADLEQRLLTLLSKFYSLEELKKLIKVARDVQSQKRQRIRLSKIEMEKMMDKLELEQGNRGYLLRDGYSTFLPKIKVEIEPLNKFSYREE